MRKPKRHVATPNFTGKLDPWLLSGKFPTTRESLCEWIKQYLVRQYRAMGTQKSPVAMSIPAGMVEMMKDWDDNEWGASGSQKFFTDGWRPSLMMGIPVVDWNAPAFKLWAIY